MLTLTKKAALLNHHKPYSELDQTDDANTETTNDNTLNTLISDQNHQSKNNNNSNNSNKNKLLYNMNELANSDEDTQEPTSKISKLSLHEFSVKLLSLFSGSVSPSLGAKYSSKLNDTSTPTSPNTWPQTSNANNNNKTNRIKNYKMWNTMGGTKTKPSYYYNGRPSEQEPGPERSSLRPPLVASVFSPKVKLLSSLSSPSIALLAATSSVKNTATAVYTANTHVTYRNNELYSILVSMFTAALFLLFIMWRWFRMKSDLRKALREQLEIQQLDNGGGHHSSSSSRRTTPSSSSSSNQAWVNDELLQSNPFISNSCLISWSV